jgi:uncharacterized membrane protein YqjE
MENPADSPPGIFASLKRLSKTLLLIAQNRLELALVELQEERSRFVEVLLLAAMVVVLASMTLLVATTTLVVLCVRANRFDLLAGLIGVFLLATAGFFWRLRWCLKNWTPFAATLAELKKDKECFIEKN